MEFFCHYEILYFLLSSQNLWKGIQNKGLKKNCVVPTETKLKSNFYSETNEMHQFLKFILFCSGTLHVSDGLSVHHQESKTVHTAAGLC